MKYIREHKKTSIIVMIILGLFLLYEFTFAGYVKNIINNYILETKGFYFNSSVLSVNGKSHNINNWDGVNDYTLTVDVNNKKNEMKSTNADITYQITYECSSNITCSVSKDSGIIYKDLKTDNYQLMVHPNHSFKEGESATVKTYVNSSSPYEKTLHATYTIGVTKSSFSYNIEDSVNSKYLVVNVTNAVGFYEVEEAFGSYQVGDLISLDNYLALSDADKEKCFSAKVTLMIPVDMVALDMTSKSYLHKMNGTLETKSYEGSNYVSKYTFKMPATSSEKIIFYKYDLEKNYTYPIVNSNSIIGVSAEVAE